MVELANEVDAKLLRSRVDVAEISAVRRQNLSERKRKSWAELLFRYGRISLRGSNLIFFSKCSLQDD